MSKCIVCKREMTTLEENLNRKLIGRGCTTFRCKTCLAEKFNCSEADLDRMIENFKRQGCSLFVDNAEE